MSDLPQDIPQESPDNELSEEVSRNLLDDATPEMGDNQVAATSQEASIPTTEEAWNQSQESFETAFEAGKAADSPEPLQQMLAKNEQQTQAAKAVIAKLEENLKEKQKLMLG